MCRCNALLGVLADDTVLAAQNAGDPIPRIVKETGLDAESSPPSQEPEALSGTFTPTFLHDGTLGDPAGNILR